MSGRQLKVAFIGECMVELREDARGALHRHCSGDTLNTAVYFLRTKGDLACAADYITALGCDRFSREMIRFWQDEGLGCDLVLQLSDKLPGLYFIHVDGRGERSFTYWRGDSAARYMLTSAGSDELLQQLPGYDVVYLSGITLAILHERGLERMVTALRKVCERGGRVCFDGNYRAALWRDQAAARLCYEELFPLCSIAFLSLEDQHALFGDDTPDGVFKRLEPFAVPEVVIRDGARGCHIQLEGDRLHVPAERVARVVDSTAAGDAFSAAFLARRLAGEDPESAARAGHRLAAEVIQVEGVFDRPLPVGGA